MAIGVIVQDYLNPLSPRGLTIEEVQARGDVTTLTSVDAVQGAGMNVTQGNEKPPAWQGDSVTGRLAPEIPGGLHFEKVLLVTPGQPVPLSTAQQRLEK